jgi:hypothetical protein
MNNAVIVVAASNPNRAKAGLLRHNAISAGKIAIEISAIGTCTRLII